ncbi:hypothetical protein FSARC_2481 [Fusarium sarcochroum]|uniref:t-SNARE coiled-coil homology domain-containing protein n=1 Tax=Fusarium sarcochroum TaxID=1208366 RepID=A0A8H4U648_9HYPO|nr:hypothetical protein FSARC_2481 [Fusarium sarcochroum]
MSSTVTFHESSEVGWLMLRFSATATATYSPHRTRARTPIPALASPVSSHLHLHPQSFFLTPYPLLSLSPFAVFSFFTFYLPSITHASSLLFFLFIFLLSIPEFCSFLFAARRESLARTIVQTPSLTPILDTDTIRKIHPRKTYGGQNPYDAPEQGYGAPAGGYGGNNGYGNGGGYNSPPAAQGYGGIGNVEMAPLAHNASSFGHGDPNAILNECRDIDRGIDTVEQNLEQLRMIQQRTLDDADSSGSSAANRQLDSLSADTMSLYRELTERVRVVKSNSEAQSSKNNPHVTRIDRRLKAAITQYQQVESQFRKRTQDQMARQYRIVRPDASEQEIQAAVEDTTGGQVFSQAMMQSDRQGRARAALSAVQDRHQALVKIEQQMVELAQLFQDMDTLVIQQEAAVTQIEQKGEEVVENLDKGNEEIGVAVNTARKTRKKKWICLGICVAIIIIIVIIVVIYMLVIKGNNNNDGGKKRSIEGADGVPFMHTAVMPARLARRAAAADSASAFISSLAGRRIHLPQLPQN